MPVREVVPFFAVDDIQASLAFYRDGLGFQIKHKWEPKGVLRWCQLQLDQAGLMLQESAGKSANTRGQGVTLCFFVDDAIEFYRGITARGVGATVPCVENGLWATHLVDPDGYRLLFESPTDTPEGTTLSV